MKHEESPEYNPAILPLKEGHTYGFREECIYMYRVEFGDELKIEENKVTVPSGTLNGEFFSKNIDEIRKKCLKQTMRL